MRLCVVVCCAFLLIGPAFAADEASADKQRESQALDTGSFEEASDDYAEVLAGDLEVPDEERFEQAYKVGYSRRPIFGGPNSPEGQLESNDRVTDPAFRLPGVYDFFEPWLNWKKGLNDDYGFQFSGHYSTLFQDASDALPGGDDKASSGVFRAVGKWELLNRGEANTGSLVVMLDHRHNFRDVAPASLANEIGYIGVTGVLYSDIDFSVVNLNWQQGLNDGNAGFLIGRYDPNDYMNILGSSNPWTHFSNVSVLLDSSVAYPDSSWGIGGGSWIDNQWYITAGLNDANGTVSDDLEFFDGGSEFFTWGEFGWSPGKDNRYFKNVHVTFWHVDERDDAGISEGEGVLFATNWTFDERIMPYMRLGWSDGAEEAVIFDRSATLGFLWKYMQRSDVAGIAVNWGSPPTRSLDDQTTIEGFWRFQLAQNFEITPSLQYLRNPALNPDENDLWVFGLRMRLTY
ncbi:MAG: carbohydrate porin [Gammaproteobacteria bacterium]